MTPVGRLTRVTETETNLSIPTGLITISKPMTRDVLVSLVTKRLLEQEGFKERLCATVDESGSFDDCSDLSFTDRNVVSFTDVH
eukprot:CAMPEP_0173404848 /NCGR_PEP_ID=MMETSP1356-20130122/60436_1 /TAXON_ID=77927 ORGANISM="Hemiselmis virescens, Strain PCC157" /NCGR_SAMPLE_ID=MMETSP1356 /ASSEMBLY_ACC=CAM_ASM_000847 /LENGTH=83 /DNA_ID=CAMNT_0014365581 /DNA_START=51 /DNA_END=299 /DNA_ORIENTATION=+